MIKRGKLIDLAAGCTELIAELHLDRTALARVTGAASVPAKWEVVVDGKAIWTYITPGDYGISHFRFLDIPPELIRELERTGKVLSCVWEPAQGRLWTGKTVQVMATNLDCSQCCDFYATIEERHV